MRYSLARLVVDLDATAITAAIMQRLNIICSMRGMTQRAVATKRLNPIDVISFPI